MKRLIIGQNIMESEVSRPKGSILSIFALAIGILGVLSPIAWDYYKAKTSLNLELSQFNTIIQKPNQIDGIHITYNGEQLNCLSKAVLTLANTGRIPISEREVSTPLTISLSNDTGLINAYISELHPTNIQTNLSYDKSSNTIRVLFSLLNPGESIQITAFTKSPQITFYPSARIAGISNITTSVKVDKSKTSTSHNWGYYTTGIFGLFMGLTGILAIKDLKKEMADKKNLKEGKFTIPHCQSFSEFKLYINSHFSYTTTKERDRIIQILSHLEPADDFSVAHYETLLTGVTSLVETATSNLVVVLMGLGSAAAGGLFLYLKY